MITFVKNQHLMRNRADMFIIPTNLDGVIEKDFDIDELYRTCPEIYDYYKNTYRMRPKHPGVPFIFDVKHHNIRPTHPIIKNNGLRYIVGIPIRNGYREPPKLDYLELGLDTIILMLPQLYVKSVVILNMQGNELPWMDVKKSMIHLFKPHTHTDVIIHEPWTFPRYSVLVEDTDVWVND